MRNAAHLITYADRLAGGLPGLARLLDGPLAGFGGVHVLPCYTPYDGDDDGFDPVDHRRIDPRLGTWDDLAAIARERDLCTDLVVNHVSARSEEFRDWLAHGERSRYAGMFLTLDRVFPAGAREADLAAVFRPRPGLPLTPYLGADGTRRLVWTTFDPTQVDLDVSSPEARAYLDGILDQLAASGVGQVRLDAVGYAVKAPGTSMFLTDETLAFIDDIVGGVHRRGMEALVEFHGSYRDQIRVARHCDRVYDFGLPPLLLHAMVTGRTDPLGEWLSVRPENAVTVLDTHDGIGLVDVGDDAHGPGILSPTQLQHLVDVVADRTGGLSRLATRPVPWRTLPYAINSTYYDAVGRDDARFLAARLVQLLTPGIPQLYYVGLLAGSNDGELFARTGKGRDLNRRHYDAAGLAAAAERPVVAAQLGLVRLRGSHPAFAGTATVAAEGSAIELAWSAGPDRVGVVVDAAAGEFELSWTTPTGLRRAATVPEVAAALA